MVRLSGFAAGSLVKKRKWQVGITPLRWGWNRSWIKAGARWVIGDADLREARLRIYIHTYIHTCIQPSGWLLFMQRLHHVLREMCGGCKTPTKQLAPPLKSDSGSVQMHFYIPTLFVITIAARRCIIASFQGFMENLGNR